MPLLLSFCNKAVYFLVNQLGRKPLSKYSLSCDLTLSCKLLEFFNHNPWTKSEPGEFQFGILPRIFFELFLVISALSWFVTLSSLCKSFIHSHLYYDLLTHSNSLPKPFWFFSIWSIISLLPDTIHNKLPLIILKHSVLSKSIYSWYLLTFAAIATILCFNSSITTANIFTVILYFLFNVC